MPLDATACQPVSKMDPSQKYFLAADHNFANHNIGPSVTMIMDINGTAGKSLFSGGVEGGGKVSFSLHDKMFNNFDALKHADYLINIMKDEADIHFTDHDRDTIQPTLYLLNIEYVSGGDHDLRRELNKIELLGMLLNGNMYKLVETRGCTGISHLNTMERVMSLLNIRLSSLALAFDPETDEWLLYENLEGVI